MTHNEPKGVETSQNNTKQNLNWPETSQNDSKRP